MNAKKLGFERNIHKLVYKHGIAPRKIAVTCSASELACRHKKHLRRKCFFRLYTLSSAFHPQIVQLRLKIGKIYDIMRYRQIGICGGNGRWHEQKYQVLVIPYCINDNQAQFCLFQRSDMGIWQFIAGGGDDEDGSIIESAKREAFEEAGISEAYNFFKLDTCCSNFICLLALIVVCFHWFNPFAWLMLKLLYSDIELACDESVL